ncbi:MAG: hypothetical protein NVSMB18_11500 [Acetobacteraceae bacterium]
MSGSFGVGMIGERALNTLYQKLGTLGQIQAAFGDSDASYQSCSANATIMMDEISDQPMTTGRMSVLGKGSLFSKPSPMPMTAGAIVSEIMQWLERPNAVYVNISNDHHFITVPISGNGVGMVQAFQGSYTLADWFEWRGFGVLDKTEYKQAMTDLLLSGAQATWIAAAKKLFSFDLATAVPGGSTTSKDKVAKDIADWFNNKPFVKSYAFKPL